MTPRYLRLSHPLSKHYLFRRTLTGSRAIRYGLAINFSKCNIIFFVRGTSTFDFEYSINSEVLPRVDSLRDLGVVYDSSLSFQDQINAVTKKCLKLLGFIRNVTLDFQQASSLVHLYESLVMPILSYCFPSWFPYSQVQLKQLTAIEHIFLRLASKKTDSPMHYFNHDYTQIRKILKIPKLETLLLRQDCMVSFQIANQLFSSDKINKLFTLRNSSYNLRNPLAIEQRVVRKIIYYSPPQVD